jgi:hypothetical protein
MKRTGGWVGLVLAAIFAVILTSSAHASGSDVQWESVHLKWATKTSTVFTGTSADSQFITDENDTTRTVAFDMSIIAWDAFAGEGVAAGPINVAYLTFSAAVTNGAADTIYYSVEKRAQVGAGAGTSIWTRNRTLAATISASAVIDGMMPVGTGAAIFQGVLQWDPDGSTLINQVKPGDVIRLVVQGDQGGTTPKLSGVRCKISYPRRVQSR